MSFAVISTFEDSDRNLPQDIRGCSLYVCIALRFLIFSFQLAELWNNGVVHRKRRILGALLGWCVILNYCRFLTPKGSLYTLIACSVLEGIHLLSPEVNREFALLGDLDKRVEDMLASIKDKEEAFARDGPSLTKEERKQRLAEIEAMFREAKALSEDKVSVSIQSYELVS
jgi:hypothetical protein